MKNKLKLYVWTEFSPDYTDGLAFAIAASEREARTLIEAERGVPVYDWSQLEVHSVTERMARSVTGGG